MEKMTLSIIKTGNQYRAVIQIGEDPCLVDKEIVYQCSIFTSEKLEEIRKLSWQLKKEAKKCVREKGIEHVVNIDFEFYT